MARKQIHVKCKNPFPFQEKTEIGEIASSEAAVRLINGILGADIRELAADPLIYCPEKKWAAIWKEIVVPYLERKRLAGTVIGQKYAEILQGFAEIKKAG